MLERKEPMLTSADMRQFFFGYINIEYDYGNLKAVRKADFERFAHNWAEGFPAASDKEDPISSLIEELEVLAQSDDDVRDQLCDELAFPFQRTRDWRNWLMTLAAALKAHSP